MATDQREERSLDETKDLSSEDDVSKEVKEEKMNKMEITAEKEALLTDDEKQEQKRLALEWKSKGNAAFEIQDYKDAIECYSEAIYKCLPSMISDRAIFYSNRAACYMKLSRHEEALNDCNAALDLNPDYVKVLLRRAQTYEALDKLDEALQDYQSVANKDSSNKMAREAVMRLPNEIKERNERLKDEMIGKLKDLGNMILNPFGLSTDNFKLNKDPTTDSYSVKFEK
ncbi:Tetratricopeptide repeat protein 1 [Trichoplax sp. H2]|uniref:Serine/threonine-protein kinase BSK1-like TPR repeats domain-containing protein n=1 Tax=Trichoplax adhaerens TaxID=10228 RepID=B3S366_TRIAD|nr:hypothetical protein TRIADDRAFT_58613 [Trichoplax adhaerens]EDV22918.1 hypothetical protein TRIADDRAFT_58613 [Trichoplax adhaerens]RDD38788.1 Tetratricopeptide repeat protein 1 [Trichoplax sp. H2]|eukprot:XP_002114784.1 hypothetical protein TRIADDRAFT_58613 [Trichoplax adhaerens]